MQLRERFVEANGLSHHVLEWGDPTHEAVLLCHGFLDLAWGFAQLAPKLAAAGFRAIALDFRGHGQTGRVPLGGYYYFPDYVLDLHELVPQLVSGSFHLLGHSMGGTASAFYAATHPDQLRSLCLLEGLGPNQEKPEKAPLRFKQWLAETASAHRAEPTLLPDLDDALARLARRHPTVEHAFLRMLAEKSTRPHPSGTGLTWCFDPLHRTHSPVSFDAARFLCCLAEIRASTLILQGEHGIASRDHAERVARIPRARRISVEGAGHMLQWTHAERVSELVLEHILSV